MNSKQKVVKIIKIFDEIYAEAVCSLNYKKPIELFVAAQLSAQCKDDRVNKVTENLYKKYKNIHDFATADLKKFEDDIRSVGFYHVKAKNIISGCKIIMEVYTGIIPDNIDDLLKLPGIGRKTANLLLGELYGVPGVVVDTHVTRLSNRIGFTKTKDAKKIEFELMEIVPKDYWNRFCHQLVYHGRAVCDAKKPKCNICPIWKYCNSFKN